MIKTKVIQTRLISKKSNFLAITLFGLVFTSDKKLITPNVLNHELIHCKQQLELLYIPFFILYLLEWVILLFKHRNWDTAYLNISFEREAYANDKNPDYLKNRKAYSWTKYLHV